MQSPLPLLTIVVPCYNEEEVLPATIAQLSSVLAELTNLALIHEKSNLLFVDDGSNDRTWSLIAMESVRSPFVTGIKLARNVGHQKAILAGLEIAKTKCDCAITIDADLQDDISVIQTFIEKYHEGYDIVYGVRDSRDTDSFFKKRTALGFYRLMKRLGIPLVANHADFRLLNRRALTELSRYQEENVFLRGIIPLLGLHSTKIYYDRKERLAGKTKYPLKKMLSFALEGITSFSITPIRFITLLGGVLFLFSLVAGSYALMQKFFGYTRDGWTSLMISIWFIGGLQLVAIGIIGEYIGKIYQEVKHRPKYTIDIDLYTNPMLNSQQDTLTFHMGNNRLRDKGSSH
ncbi:glycosyltransferase family 2 protein [Caldibacillus lycopersici]|uniref:Glycosyltransferase family 2 protein n=1 Tax=Perspicuibacillus lycopersici TaxID=1325689 RepID=A0AAE3LMX3_9BACI|nr:glycosyltransferase family 2 protein [Perspicuibacillus lycopersici]MCU9613376.1 glycosyltransferase family 2 protein [Perspicuibacillus lycopersici]